MLIGLLSGAIAAIVASLLSLPLRSPDNALFNTASVTVAALVAGMIAALLRRALPLRTFIIAWVLGAAIVIAALAAGEALLVRLFSFGAPLAATVFAITGVLTATLTGRTLPALRQGAAVAVVVAIATGIGLAGRGDAASGRLALPTAPASTTALTAAATVSPTGSAPATAGAALPAQFTTPVDVQGVTFAVGQGSSATFTVNEKLANLPLPSDAVMHSTALTGNVFLDGRPSKITLDLLQLSSDQPRRDDFMRQQFRRSSPTATLTVTTLPALPDHYTAGQSAKATVQGTLAINGVERPVSFDVEARIDGTTLFALGRTSFVWSDFNMRPPNTPTVSVQDRVAVEVLIAGHAQAG